MFRRIVVERSQLMRRVAGVVGCVLPTATSSPSAVAVRTVATTTVLQQRGGGGYRDGGGGGGGGGGYRGGGGDGGYRGGGGDGGYRGGGGDGGYRGGGGAGGGGGGGGGYRDGGGEGGGHGSSAPQRGYPPRGGQQQPPPQQQQQQQQQQANNGGARSYSSSSGSKPSGAPAAKPATPPADGLTDLARLSGQLNQLKRSYKNSRDVKEQKTLIREARTLLGSAVIAPNEEDEKAVALTLNAAAFFAVPADSRVVQTSVTWFRENLGGCEAQHVALYAHAVAALGVADADRILTQEVAPRGLAVLATMMPVEMAMILQAFARRNAPKTDNKGDSKSDAKNEPCLHPDLFDAVLQRATAVMPTVKVGELSTMCSALAALGLHKQQRHAAAMEAFLAAAVPVLTAAASGLNSAGLAQLLQALAAFGLTASNTTIAGCGELLTKLCARGAGIGYQSTELPAMYEALAALQCGEGHPEVWAKLDERVSVCTKFLVLPEITRIAAACQLLPRACVPKSLAELFAPTPLGKTFHRASVAQVGALVAELALLGFRFDPLYILAVQKAARLLNRPPPGPDGMVVVQPPGSNNGNNGEDGGDGHSSPPNAGGAPPVPVKFVHHLAPLVQVGLACAAMLGGSSQQADLDLAALTAQTIGMAGAAPLDEVASALVVLFAWSRRSAAASPQRQAPPELGSIAQALVKRVAAEGLGAVKPETVQLLRTVSKEAGAPPLKIAGVTWLNDNDLRRLKL